MQQILSNGNINSDYAELGMYSKAEISNILNSIKRYDQICKDNLKLKSTFSIIFKQKVAMDDGVSSCVLMFIYGQRSVCKVSGMVFRSNEDATKF